MPALQHPVMAGGQRLRVDFAFLPQRVVGEADGIGKHLEHPERSLRAQAHRQTLLEHEGFFVMRWGWQQVHPHHEVWLRALTRALARTTRPR